MNTYTLTKNNIVFKFGYNKHIVNSIKTLFTGRRYNRIDKSWIAPLDAQNNMHLKYMVDEYNFIQSKEKMYSFEELKNITLSVPYFRNEIKDIVSKIPFKLKPREYQIKGVADMLNVCKVLNGDQMGLGKTGQVIIAAEVANLYPILIITPNSVKYNWEKEWNKWLDGKDISVIDKKEKNFDADIVIINYDIVTKNYKELKKRKWECITLDESQYVKNSKSQRSKSCKNLSKNIDYKFLLSGTPIMNKPSELIHQLKIIDAFDIFGDWKQFIYKFCDAHITEFGLDYTGASNTFELNKIMRENCYIRRETSDVMKELPSLNQQFFDVPFTLKKDYRLASKDIVQYLTSHVNIEAAERAENAPYLVMAIKLKELSILGKLGGIKNWIDDYLLSTNDKLLVYGIRTAPLKELSKNYGCNLIYGGTSAKDKLKMIEDFQVDNNQILFGNIQSLGTGVDGLQYACKNILFIELPDRPTDISQAVARVHRSGQVEAVTSYFIFSQDNIDSIMWEILEEKREVIEAINKGLKIQKTNLKSMNYEITKRVK